MDFDALDFAAFFDPDCPGYALATIGGVAVPGIFSAGYSEAFGLVSGSSPAFVCQSTLVSGASEGASVGIAGVAYTVTGIEPDGTGMTLLRLAKS